MNEIKFSLNSIIGENNEIPVRRGDEEFVKRIRNHEIPAEMYDFLSKRIKAIGVTEEFKKVIRFFKVPQNETPAGFRVEYNLCYDGLVEANLVRDISYDKNGKKRPTKVLFSADTANPYEVEKIKDLIANLTCNPAIIYNLFINNPEANVGNKYKDRDEVMRDIGNILGPGCDISVELNDPFNASESEILEECERFKELLSEYRVVIKVPHTGPVNKNNVSELLNGNKRFNLRYDEGNTGDFFRGHNLALMLHEHGYRVNFTLMFETYQTALALQAKPYFINSFITFRETQSRYMAGLMKAYEETADPVFVDMLKQYMIENDYVSAREASGDTFSAYSRAKEILRYREFEDNPAADGLDGIRHNLRCLKQANLPDTRLIICNFHNCNTYPYIDKLLMEPEFADMADRIVITGPPNLLASYTSSPLVIQFHRRFMNATSGQK